METIIYTVRSGDTLFDIAKRFCTTVGMITRYNGIIEPDRIYPDQILRIPVSEIPTKSSACKPQSSIDYIVKSGDTLSSISRMHGVSVDRIAEYNELSDPDDIKAGQVLKIPITPNTKKQSQEYTVQKGDTLTSIADRYDTSVQKLVRKNNISDPDVIIEGQTLRVPSPTVSDNADMADNERTVYTVQEGDTLWQIARKYGVSVSYLINLNRLTDPERIYPGQTIYIN